MKKNPIEIKKDKVISKSIKNYL